MNVRWLRPDDPAWLEHLASVPHDIYHLPGYVATTAHSDGGEPWAVCITEADASLFVPLLVREIPAELSAEGWRDAMTPYGYPTPLVRSPDDAMTRQLFAALKDALLERHIVSLFCRLHPLLPLPQAPAMAVGTLVQHGQTVYRCRCKSITSPSNVAFSNHRRDVTRQSSLKQAICGSKHPWQDVAIFHRSVVSRNDVTVDAKDYYFFEGAYFNHFKASTH